MTNQVIIFFLGLCPIIPASVHLAESLIFVAEFWFLFAAAILAQFLSEYLNMNKVAHFMEYPIMLMAAVVYSELLGVLFPVLMVGLQSYVYIFAFSSILIVSITQYAEKNRSVEIPVSYILLLIIVATLRELFVFGTLSLPAPSGLLTIKLLPSVPLLAFLGSNAGVLMLLGVGLWLYRSFQAGELLPFKTDISHR